MYAKKIIICLVLVHSSYSQDFPSVKTRLGEINGYFKVSANGNKYEAYEGIPYALPPTGDRRFMPPELTTSWQGKLNATKFRDLCMGHSRQPAANDSNNYVVGVEDCLYLNVYVPIKKVNTSSPVIIWIYGGAFQYGSLTGNRQTYLIDNDIIFVSFSHRHGSLGFLSTGDEVVTGNMGLKDQSSVLKWVSQNIEFFGGDSKRISLMGLSAGGASVHYHYLSKMSARLFQSGISFSGTSFNSWTQAKDSKNKAIRLAKLVNCTTHDTMEMVKCLKTRPARDIVAAQIHFMPWHLNEMSPFGPVVEKNSDNPFIDRSPIDIINSGDVYDAPWITGVVSEEGLAVTTEFATNQTAFEDLDENWDTIAPHLLQYYYTVPKKNHGAVAQKIRSHYLADQPITQDNFFDLIHLCGDRLFFVDAVKAARAQAKVNKNPVWFYYYSYRAATSFSDNNSNSTTNFGVSHADDVYLTFGDSVIDPTRTAKDFAMHEELIRFWLSVAQKGGPNFGPKWTPINQSSTYLNYLHMKAPGNFLEETNDNWGEKNFWETIDFNENEPTTYLSKSN